jgi:hypothetical protein
MSSSTPFTLLPISVPNFLHVSQPAPSLQVRNTASLADNPLSHSTLHPGPACINAYSTLDPYFSFTTRYERYKRIFSFSFLSLLRLHEPETHTCETKLVSAAKLICTETTSLSHMGLFSLRYLREDPLSFISFVTFKIRSTVFSTNADKNIKKY